MCGIFGMVLENDVAATSIYEKFLKDSMITGQLRGEDSTGIFAVTATGHANRHAGTRFRTKFTYKLAVPGSYFAGTRPISKLFGSPRVLSMIGHHRAATLGHIIDANAHPFQHGNIILVHNGSLTNHDRLEDGRNFDVDSEYVAYAFNKFGVEETLKEIRGAFAFVWYDRSDNTINMVRNDQRPLHIAEIKNGDGYMFASEGGDAFLVNRA